MVDTSLIASTDLFADLEDAQIAPIAGASEQRQLRRGDVLFLEGDEPHDLYIVVSGRIAISNRSPDGRESVVALMEPGDLFGEMPLFDRRGRSAGARALEPSDVVIVPYEPVRDLYQQNPSLLWRVVDMLAMRLRNMDLALADSVFLDVTGRVAGTLLELCKQPDAMTHPDGMQIKVTRQEIGRIVGCSREMVGRVLKTLEEQHLISVSGKTIVVFGVR